MTTVEEMIGNHGPSALEVLAVSHAFGARTALDDVGFRIDPGQHCVLLGLNGAGKTTLFSLITRLYGTRAGEIRVFDHDVRRESGQALSRLGVVFQPRTLDLDLTVMQNLLYHASLHGIPPGVGRRRADEELARLGLADRARDKVRNLSGGQMRRVEIARALLHQPGMLLLDEPTVGLDIDSRQAIVDHVQDLCRDKGLAVLWATHLIDEVLPSSRVVVLHHGRVLADGTVPEVLAQAGGTDVRDAFTRLTRAPAPASEEHAA